LVLSDADRVALDARASRELLLAVAAQAAAGLVAATIAGIVAGTAAGLSALLGAAAYWLPNALFALRLLVNVARPGRANPYVFFFGELTKLLLSGLLLGLLIWLGRSWLVPAALLAGLLLTMKGHLPLLLLRKPS
jgi:ATP synthase protein I